MSVIGRVAPFLAGGGGALTYATWNPADKGASLTLSGGNLSASGSGQCRATIGKSTGKWYWEIAGNYDGVYGVGNLVSGLTTPGNNANSVGFYPTDYATSSQVVWNAGVVAIGVLPSAYTFGFALDADAKTLKVYAANGLLITINLASGGGSYVPAPFYPYMNRSTATADVLNAGASAFALSVPSGYNPGLYT